MTRKRIAISVMLACVFAWVIGAGVAFAQSTYEPGSPAPVIAWLSAFGLGSWIALAIAGLFIAAAAIASRMCSRVLGFSPFDEGAQ